MPRRNPEDPGSFLAAHSMGGLVALSAINKFGAADFPRRSNCTAPFPRLMAEMKPQKNGSTTAPIVVPVWRDIGAPSAFLDDLIKKPFPKNLPFYLFFSITTLQNSSWVKAATARSSSVPSSYLRPDERHKGHRVQRDARWYPEQPAARDSFLRLLDTVSPPRSTGVNGP